MHILEGVLKLIVVTTLVVLLWKIGDQSRDYEPTS
jgi:hypothetical protein